MSEKVDLRNRYENLQSKIAARKGYTSSSDENILQWQLDFLMPLKDDQCDLFLLNGASSTYSANSSQLDLNNRSDLIISLILVSLLDIPQISSEKKGNMKLARQISLPQSNSSSKQSMISVVCSTCTFINHSVGVRRNCEMCNSEFPSRMENVKLSPKKVEVVIIDSSSDDEEYATKHNKSDFKTSSCKSVSSPNCESKSELSQALCFQQLVRFRSTLLGYRVDFDSINVAGIDFTTVSECPEDLPSNELELLGIVDKRYSTRFISSADGEGKSKQENSGIRLCENDENSNLHSFEVFGRRFGDPKRKGKSKFCGLL